MAKAHTAVRGIVFATALTAAVYVGHLERPVGANEVVSFHGGTPSQEAVVDWAIKRYRAAGMGLPHLDVHFHADPSGCAGNSGIYHDDRLDICATGKAPAYVRKVIVHELAHAWSDAHLTAEDRERFINLRGLQHWGSEGGTRWSLRGCEQAAEIITWGVGDGAIPPLLPEDDEPGQLRMAFELLVGGPPLRPTA